MRHGILHTSTHPPSRVRANPTLAVLLAACGLACGAVHGQQAPTGAQEPAARDAQQLRRASERAAQERQRQLPPTDVRLQGGAAPATTTRLPQGQTPCFQIRQLELLGEEASRFGWALDAAAGPGADDSPLRKCLGPAGIDIVLQRVQDAVRARGYATTRVLAGRQELSTGTLALTVVPGRIRAVRFAEGSGQRATLWNTVPARPGDILNVHDVEQALENFKRLPTVQADIRIEPVEGAGPGLSDLVISHGQASPVRLSMSFDDSGTKSTGKYQGAITASYDNWWTLSDLFYVTLNHDMGGGDAGDRGTRGGTVHYSLPMGDWLLAGTLSRNRYAQTVAGATQNYVYAGTSRTAELKASRVVYRDAVRKTTAGIRAFQRQSNSFIDDTEIQVQRRVVGGWELGVTHREALGVATLDVSVAYRRGTGAFGSLPAPEEPFGEGTSRFALIAADANLALPFQAAGQRLRYSATWRGQAPRTPLTPQDRFAIGGRYTVRGFDGESSLSAERGWLLRNEVAVALGDSGQEFFTALDHGQVGGPSAALLAGTRLTGAVIGLRGSLGAGGRWGGMQYEIFAGAPLRKPASFVTARTTLGFQLNYAL